MSYRIGGIHMASRLPSPSIAPVPEVQIAAKKPSAHRWLRWLIGVLLLVAVAMTSLYGVLSCYIATSLVNEPRVPIYSTPAALGLKFQNVTFPSREDHLQLRGWLIPGIRSDGSLTTQRTIIMVHGHGTNRADKDVGLLDLSSRFARNGFAVLTFDARGKGESASAPLSLGYFEQRDVLGAVDFLQSGPLPYPELGRPHAIAGWGVSMGGATLLLAAAREPAIRAIVSDCAYADAIPIVERDIPRRSHLPQMFTPGTILATRAIYGMDLYATRPVAVVKNLAPRPVFFIHGDSDTTVPPSDMNAMATAARAAPNSHVQTWLVTGGIEHAKAFETQGNLYVSRIVDFYTTALGPDTGAASS
jgi:uncharacterized protein